MFIVRLMSCEGFIHLLFYTMKKLNSIGRHNQRGFKKYVAFILI